MAKRNLYQEIIKIENFLHKIYSIPLEESELYHYWAYWDDLKKEQKRRGFGGCDDVRAAGAVLDELSIPNIDVSADDSDKKGWRVYWR